MDLAALMSRMEDDDEPGLTNDQIATRLEEYHALVHGQEPETFTPGQIVWHKMGKAADTRGSEHPHIFIGYLPSRIVVRDNLAAEKMGTPLGPLELDAIYAAHIGGSTSEFLCDTRKLTATAPRS